MFAIPGSATVHPLAYHILHGKPLLYGIWPARPRPMKPNLDILISLHSSSS